MTSFYFEFKRPVGINAKEGVNFVQQISNVSYETYKYRLCNTDSNKRHHTRKFGESPIIIEKLIVGQSFASRKFDASQDII